MAPEQFSGRSRRFGPWTDLYGFGMLAWQVVFGVPPFQRGSILELKAAHESEPLPRVPVDAPVPVGFGRWVARLCAKTPSERFRSAAEARAELAGLRDAGPRGLGSGNGARYAATTLAMTMENPGKTAIRPPADAKVPGSLLGLRALPVLGREVECAQLWSACQGGPGTVQLVGPPGYGTSRLGRWLCEEVESSGAGFAVRVPRGRTVADVLLERLGADGLEGPALAQHLQQTWGLPPTTTESGIEAIFQQLPGTWVVWLDAPTAWTVPPWMAVFVVVSGGERLDGVEPITVRGLSRDAMETLMTEAAALSRTRRVEVLEASAGSPGHALQLLRHGLDGTPVDPGVERWSDALNALSRQDQRAVELAAALGPWHTEGEWVATAAGLGIEGLPPAEFCHGPHHLLPGVALAVGAVDSTVHAVAAQHVSSHLERARHPPFFWRCRGRTHHASSGDAHRMGSPF